MELFDTNILTYLLSTFMEVASGGYTRLAPEALNLMKFFVTIEIVVLGVWWALGSKQVTTTVIRKLTLFGVFLWLINDMHLITKTILISFGELGLIASNYNISSNILFDPSKIISLGFKTIKPILLDDLSIWDILSPLNKIYLIVAAPLILFTYAVIAFNLFLTIVEYYVFTMFSVVLIPFGFFKPTKFLSEKAISHTFCLGIKFMVLSFIIGFSYEYLEAAKVPSNIRILQLFNIVLSSGFIAFLSWRVPSMVSNFIMGTPGLSMEDIYNSGKSLVGTGASIYSGVGAYSGTGTKHIYDKVAKNQDRIKQATNFSSKSSQIPNNRVSASKPSKPSSTSINFKRIDVKKQSSSKQNIKKSDRSDSSNRVAISKATSTNALSTDRKNNK